MDSIVGRRISGKEREKERAERAGTSVCRERSGGKRGERGEKMGGRK